MDDELKQFLHKANTNGYAMAINGDLAHFDAVETISRNDKVVYTARFLGGLVDVRREED